MSKIDTNVLHDGQLAVATVDQSGTITKKSAINTNILVQTEDGEQLCVATYPLNGGGGGGTGADTSLSNLTDTGKIKVAHLAMPSITGDKLTNPTLDTATEYTAPADGEFRMFAKALQHSIAWMAVSTGGKDATTTNRIDFQLGRENDCLVLTMLVRKGDSVLVLVESGLTFSDAALPNLGLYFIYAEGAKSQYQGA